MKIHSRVVLSAFVATLLFSLPIAAGTSTVPDAARIKLAMEKLNVLGSVLYIGAHPDDENTALLALLANGKHVRTAYLSMTRGEGGQNLVGSEQGEYLGLLRTEELLAARATDGAEQYFTRAIDFGFSKTSSETLEKWGKERILADVVWVIRKFRPDVVITRFTPELGGHGNHTASAILAEEAFRAAGDPARFPDQLQYVSTWTPRRLFWNVFRFGPGPSSPPPPHSVALDLGTYSPLLGKSYTELAALSRSMHKTQGFGSAEMRGSFVNYFQPLDGDTTSASLFDGIDMGWSRISGGETVGRILAAADSQFVGNDPSTVVPLLVRAYRILSGLHDSVWVPRKMLDLRTLIAWCAGIHIEANADRPQLTRGSRFVVRCEAINRSRVPMKLGTMSTTFCADTALDINLAENEDRLFTLTGVVPEDAPYSQPYWLEKPSDGDAYAVDDQRLIGSPESADPVESSFSIVIDGTTLPLTLPVRFRWVDPVMGERYRGVIVVPPISLHIADRVYAGPLSTTKDVAVTVRSNVDAVSGAVRLRLSAGWSISPESVPFTLQRKGDASVEQFRVAFPAQQTSGTMRAEATVGSATVDRDEVVIDHPYVPLIDVLPPAESRIVALDLKKKGTRLAYIMGPGDEMPPLLAQIGYNVSLLSDDDLASEDLAKFDVIVAGVRAYTTRTALVANQRRLLDYVRNGGTYVVQYVTPGQESSRDIGPYPIEVSRDRVSVEDAPVKLLDPTNPILNFPNRIGPSDFDGWVQERGLWFADTWDGRYTALLSCHDPSEPPRNGGLLVTQYGKGYYVYTGYAWFRQLPAGVPGAFRIFANILSLGK